MDLTFPEFFENVTGNPVLPYQARFAADPFTNTLLIAATGLGKTDTVLIPWLYAVAGGSGRPPTRLAFVLPRRNLTEQVSENARKRVKAAGLEAQVTVLELMGGSSDNDKMVRPDQFAIFVGTQDILVSRALNRGYARKPFRWPLDFALLNNDCYWVFDEVQLISDSLATSAQLAAFRQRFETFGAAPTVWMSATVDRDWLRTVDFEPFAAELRLVTLDEDDHRQPVVESRCHAAKTLEKAPSVCRTPDGCAEFLLSQHKPGERSLIIANTVSRAREIAAAIRKRSEVEVILLHSRFRQPERDRAVSLLHDKIPDPGRIIVSTQVIEAGIDISANRLVTDIAPWGSMVQRFGRINRYGELPAAHIWWVDRPLNMKRRALAQADSLKPKEEEEIFRPYAVDDVHLAQSLLQNLESAAPADIPKANGAPPWRHVLRRADLLDLFDTSPDLSGNELDVSRFVRSGEEWDVYFAWRNWGRDSDPPPEMPRVRDEELCAAPIGEAREFAKKRPVYTWSFLRRAWVKVERWYPGMIALVRAEDGGYTNEDGWEPASKGAVSVAEVSGEGEDGYGDDRRSWVSYRQSLTEHTQMVVSEMAALVNALRYSGVDSFGEDLEVAAVKHDWGKSHDVMQQTLHDSADRNTWTELLAKQTREESARKHSRRHFRHELASALAMIQHGDSDLAAYLAAAHHGRIRVTLRSMPGERGDRGCAIARGVQDGDLLPACDLGSAVRVPEAKLSLEVMRLGFADDDSPSWTQRAIRLRDELGPFRLAYLELLLRTADETASEKAGRTEPCTP